MTNSVAEKTPEAQALHEQCEMIRALMGGTKAMRAAGEAYLPQFDGESDKAYKARKASTTLFNGLKKTVKDMAGRVFEKSVEVKEGALDSALEENIDGQGNDLSTFAKDVFEDGLACGISFIMADAPKREGETTVAQAASENLRPYLVHIKAESILGWKSALIGSQTVLTQLRIMEEVRQQDEKDEFTETTVEQVRVLTLDVGGVNVRIYRRADANKEWAVVDEFVTDASEITVAPFYAARTGFFTAEPPLQDLADLNIAHWQSSSDQRSILHFARVPIWFAAGVTEDEFDKATISAGSLFKTRNEGAKLESVEHTGAAIEAGRNDLKDLEFQMQAMGLQLLVAGQETATGAALDAAKETAPLAMMADSLKDTLERCLAWMSDYGGSAQSYQVEVNKDFGVIPMTAQEITAMVTAVNAGLLSRETAIRKMAVTGFIPNDINAEDEVERIASEDAQFVVTENGGE